MQPDLEALLAVQAEDAAIRALDRKRASIEPRRLDLERRREVVSSALDRARHAAETEERRMRDLQGRITEHRTLHERNVSQLEQVRRLREATAATAQVEQARRILADEEGELSNRNRRVAELREAVARDEAALAAMDAEMAPAREALDAEARDADAAASAARAHRAETARGVPSQLLGRYDKISLRKKGEAIFPLRGNACGSCDTALPLQRRSVMARTGAIEICEGCGVLLYSSGA